MLLSAMIFASNADMQTRLERRFANLGDIKIFPTPERRPSAADIVRFINSYGAELVAIEFYNREDALRVEETIRVSCPNVAILGIAEGWQSESLLRIGGRYLRIVPSNVSPEDFRAAVMGSMDGAKTPGPENLIVFIPSKAGCGASTIALNVTGALAAKCGKSAILIEADLHSGPAAMYLNFEPARSVIDALESPSLDANWNDLITPVGNFAILPAPSHTPASHPSSWAYRRLIAYVRYRYEYVIFDLPEVVNSATEAIVSTAKVVYVVCTPEVPSLILARKRCAALVAHGVPEDRLQIVLNRHAKDGPDTAAISDILGYPIAQVIPNDYKSLWDANLKRRLVDEKSLVGRAFEAFAWNLTGKPMEEAKAPRKLFGIFSAA